jgi:hypothetical protein
MRFIVSPTYRSPSLVEIMIRARDDRDAAVALLWARLFGRSLARGA